MLATQRVVQLDSVNVVARAHELVFFSRLGPYDIEALERFLWHSGEAFEYWGHEASLLPIADRPLYVHRMAGGWHWRRVEAIGHERPDLVSSVLGAVRERGPLRPRDLGGGAGRGTWWAWSDTKLALEHLFLTGHVTTSHRVGFERFYDLPERVHPPGTLDVEAPPAAEAREALLAAAGVALGVATASDLADYFRMRPREARSALDALVASGRLVEVEVEGWGVPAYTAPDVTIPRAADTTALLAPFDPVVWNRERTERLFGFRYRLEIYVPGPKRVHGYYVLPFLMGERLVARTCLKADRAARRLLVRTAYAEPDVDHDRVASALATELETMATWLGLGGIEVSEVGDLAGPLRGRLR